jgi:hypothetical protein
LDLICWVDVFSWFSFGLKTSWGVGVCRTWAAVKTARSDSLFTAADEELLAVKSATAISRQAQLWREGAILASLCSPSPTLAHASKFFPFPMANLSEIWFLMQHTPCPLYCNPQMICIHYTTLYLIVALIFSEISLVGELYVFVLRLLAGTFFFLLARI